MIENYYEARLSLIVKGDATSRMAFFTELDKILDAWQELGETFVSPLTWDDVEADLIYASASEANFDENPLNLNANQQRIEAEHKAYCITCQTSYSWQMCGSLRKALGK